MQMWSLAIYQPPQRSRYKRAVYVYGNNHTNGTFKDFDHFKVPSVVNIATFCHLCTRVNVAVSDGQGVLHYPRPLLARQLRFEANVTLRFLRQFVAASRRDAKKKNKKKNVDPSVVLKLNSSTQSVHIIYLIRLLKFLLFSVHPHWAAERATVSENLNPRVGSMIVLSLLSSVLLLEEAAAEKGPGTFFSKGKLRVDVGGMGIKAGPLKLSAC